MKTSYPFELDWLAKCGPVTITGKGLCPPNVKEVVDEFIIALPQVQVKVSPKLGTVELDQNLTVVVEPGKLLWFRRMEMSYGTHDTTIDCRPQPVFYGVGIEGFDGKKDFVKIFEDGTIKL